MLIAGRDNARNGVNRFPARCVLAACAALLSFATAGAELAVTVTGHDGNPVRYAVVSLAGDSAQASSSEPLAIIDQSGKQFAPWVLAATAGEDIAFSNHDDIAHHVYSFSPAKRFSFRLQSGEKHAPIRFDEPGIVVLGCNIHDWMVGYVHVSDAAFTAATDASGKAVFTGVPAGDWNVMLWHPGLEKEISRRVTLAAAQTLTIDLRLDHALEETGPREPLDDSSYALP